jgi:2-iminobutanoate/2-iminopropanoate deaminase
MKADGRLAEVNTARTSIYIEDFGHKNPIPAAARIGNVIYASSVHGKDPATGEVAPTLEAQCALMFAHMKRIVEAAGGSTGDIIKVTIWLADRAQREAVNEQWLAMFPDPASRPARHSMQADLDGGQLVVGDFVAVRSAPSASDGDRR